MPNATVRASAKAMPKSDGDRTAAIIERVNRRYNQPGLLKKGLEILAGPHPDAAIFALAEKCKEHAALEDKLGEAFDAAENALDDIKPPKALQNRGRRENAVVRRRRDRQRL
jgi:hypothetical protein